MEFEKPRSGPVRDSLRTAALRFSEALTGSPAEAYLRARGISPETAAAHRLGYAAPGAVGTDPLYRRFENRLAVPNLNAAGLVVQIKFRALGDSDQKYDQVALPNRLFNLQALKQSSNLIALCEGEFDVLTCTELGIPAVGIPGADSWKDYHSRIFAGYDDIVMFQHDDKSGYNLMKKVMASGLPVRPSSPPGGCNDLNDALLEGFGDEIRKAVYR